MFRVASHFPQLSPWFVRLGKIPRWGWIAIGLGVVLPVVVILASVALVAIISGAVVFAAVMTILMLRRLWLRLTGQLRDSGRKNVRIIPRDPPYSPF